MSELDLVTVAITLTGRVQRVRAGGDGLVAIGVGAGGVLDATTHRPWSALSGVGP